MILKAIAQVSTRKPKYEVADIFRRHARAYRLRYGVTSMREKVIQAIINCRTAALGGFVEMCDRCSRLRVSYCSCKNRHCPKCQSFEKAQWLAKQQAKMLPIPYFHAVFTTDHAINELAWVNPRQIYDLLFRTAAKVLKQYGQRYLGGEIGFTAVLHTWGQDMRQHIHLHVIVTGGALQQGEGGERWQKARKKFLFPVLELSADFRDEFCQGLLRLQRKGKLWLRGPVEGLDVGALAQRMKSKKWEVFIRPAFDKPEQIYDYLARYIYRIAISNYRILDFSNGQVSFSYYDNKDQVDGKGKQKVMSLPALEFMRRFLLHVLPFRFVRVRHYGLHDSNKRQDLERCRALLGLEPELPEPPQLKLSAWVQEVLGVDPLACPFCGEGRMWVCREFGPLRGWKAKLLPFLGLPLQGATVG